MSTAPRLDELALSASRVAQRIEERMTEALRHGAGPRTPPRLREAMEYAVFPGGGRLRPSLCLAVAASCDESRDLTRQRWAEDAVERALAGAAAVELIHCASLVHDDMPCFDDADLRRGKPTVHKRFGEATALLVGDALIVLAFETLARAGKAQELVLLAAGTGATRGIIAGQAWENEPAAPLDEYHRAKTGALFDAAAGMGALAAGSQAELWRPFGEWIGAAYQAADDLSDALALDVGKSTGRDLAKGRPSVVWTYGTEAAKRRVQDSLKQAKAAIPACPQPEFVHMWLDHFGRKVGL
jgi:geranylgeranyl diphosphate synthase type II